MIMNSCIASFYIIIGTFDSLVTFIGIVLYIYLVNTNRETLTLQKVYQSTVSSS